MTAPNPCGCGRAAAGPYDPKTSPCYVCWLFANTRYGGDAVPAAARQPIPGAGPSGPCRHRGEPVPIREVLSLGLVPTREWVYCGNPAAGTHGTPVSWCSGCRPGCPGYEPPDHDPAG